MKKNELLHTNLLIILNKNNLTEQQMEQTMLEIMHRDVPQAQTAAFLTAMQMKGLTANEIVGAVNSMRKCLQPIDITDTTAVDIVGTGGDGASLFNVSTASAFVTAAAGVTVAKHGNYGVSSTSGSANMLDAAGVNINMDAKQSKLCINNIGITFMFAPIFHKAMKKFSEVRKILGFKTFMNLLGPLTNPANVKNLIIGTYSKDTCYLLADALQNLSTKHVMVVHSEDGLDEISPVKNTFVIEIKDKSRKEYFIDPKKFNMNYNNLDDLTVTNPHQSFNIIKLALKGKNNSKKIIKAQNIIALNAGAAIFIAGAAKTYIAGVENALSIIKSGKALQKLKAYAKFSQQFVKN